MGIVIFIIVVIVLIFIWVEIDASNEKIAQKSFMDKYNIDPNNDKYLLFKLIEQ
ncbi:MAG: hypothetical protein IJW28_01900 [Clostridia bacterium]|nr:hypothetical protein [Clostridia bacterium]